VRLVVPDSHDDLKSATLESTVSNELVSGSRHVPPRPSVPAEHVALGVE